MKTKEIRQELSKHDRNILEDIIIELYKKIPKSKKEEYNIDSFIINPIKESKKEVLPTSFNELKEEIKYFLDCVDNEYYSSPNKIISKEERSKWRFKVRRYIKELNKIDINNPFYEDATSLLIELYKRLSKGSHYLLFSNWETFKAVSISQNDFYDLIVKRILVNDYTKEDVTECLNLLEVPKDSYASSYDMFDNFTSNISKNKEEVIDLLKDKINVLKKEIKISKDSTYEKEDMIDSFMICIMDLYFSLDKIDVGIKYFKENYIHHNEEGKMYIILEKLEKYELYTYWIKEYEENKINYRQSLVEKYNEIKNKE